MVLPVITGRECAKLPVRQFSDFQFPPIHNVPDNKLSRIWSTVCDGFLKTESKIKQCTSIPNKDKKENTETVAREHEFTEFHLPSIFEENMQKILNEERSLKEMVKSKVSSGSLEQSDGSKGIKEFNLYD